MKILCMIIVAGFLALNPVAMAVSPIDAIAAPIQEQVNVAGQELQQKAVQHILEGNLTSEHIAQDLNVTAENLTDQARERLNSEIDQKINQSLNLTAEQLSQRAAEEVKNRVSQKMQASGFEFPLALMGLLAGIYLLQRRI